MKIRYYSIRRIILFVAIVTFIMTTFGCSAKSSASVQATSTPSASQPTPKVDQIKDAELTKQLTSEKGVLGGQVYFQGNDYVVAAMLVDKGTDNKTAQALAQKYADLLKQKYKDKKVNVQAVNNGANVANILK